MTHASGTRPGGEPIDAAVVGATGIVGQRLVRLLEAHPAFRLSEVVGSRRSAGRRYGEAIEWVTGGSPPVEAAGLEILGPGAALRSPLVLSALPSPAAREAEPSLARRGHVVCTNASAHRLDKSVPLVVPEVNPQAAAAAHAQPWSGSRGALIANPNCVVAGLALALAPLQRAFGIEAVTVVTLQAVSGAGRAGVASVEILGNVVPWVRGEEEKIAPELNKILETDFAVAVGVNRVPVLDGHTAHVFCTLRRPASARDAAEVLRDFRPPAAAARLPSTPARPLVVRDEPDRPQPRLDAEAAGGMAVSVGRIRPAPSPHDLALVVVAHNGARGAAGACLANAELWMGVHVNRGSPTEPLRPPPIVSRPASDRRPSNHPREGTYANARRNHCHPPWLRLRGDHPRSRRARLSDRGLRVRRRPTRRRSL